MRTHRIDFKEFTSGRYKDKRSKNKAVYATILTVTGAYMTILVPRSALAASKTTSGDMNFDDLYESLMGLFDGAVVIMIMFCGVIWAIGNNRGAAIERLIGVGAGYLLARKALVIKNWLSGM